jgi:hypothetical protein
MAVELCSVRRRAGVPAGARKSFHCLGERRTAALTAPDIDPPPEAAPVRHRNLAKKDADDITRCHGTLQRDVESLGCRSNNAAKPLRLSRHRDWAMQVIRKLTLHLFELPVDKRKDRIPSVWA